MKLSVLLPIYNEERELAACLDRVLASIADEIIAVDDCSADATPQILARYRDPRLRVARHAQNCGKGSGIQTALEHATSAPRQKVAAVSRWLSVAVCAAQVSVCGVRRESYSPVKFI